MRADPGGFAWTLLLGSALVIVIGLIGYLVYKGNVVPHAAAPAAALSAPASKATEVPAPPPLTNPPMVR